MASQTRQQQQMDGRKSKIIHNHFRCSNASQTKNHEAYRPIFKFLTEDCNTEIAVLFIHRKTNRNVSCFQKMVPKNYDIIRNQSVPSNNEGFAAILIHRSLVYRATMKIV